MKKIFLSLLFLGGASAFANTEEGFDLKLKVSAVVDQTLVGNTPDHRSVMIVCGWDLWGNAWADMVFPNRHGKITVAEYKTLGGGRSLASEEKSAYRPLSKEHASTVCQQGHGEYRFRVGATTADLKQVVNSQKARSFPVVRRSL